MLTSCSKAKNDNSTDTKELNKKISRKLEAYQTDLLDNKTSMKKDDAIKNYLVNWGKAKGIQNETDKQVAILKAQAEKNSAKLKAEGEAKYMETLQQAYNDKDKADFYNYIRSLDALKVSLSGTGEKKLMLGKDSELAKILYGNID